MLVTPDGNEINANFEHSLKKLFLILVYPTNSASIKFPAESYVSITYGSSMLPPVEILDISVAIPSNDIDSVEPVLDRIASAMAFNLSVSAIFDYPQFRVY